MLQLCVDGPAEENNTQNLSKTTIMIYKFKLVAELCKCTQEQSVHVLPRFETNAGKKPMQRERKCLKTVSVDSESMFDGDVCLLLMAHS